MGFLDKAKAAANDLAAKADTALGNAGLGGPAGSGGGEADRLLRDLGMLTYLEAKGRPADLAERARLVAALQELESRGALRDLDLHSAPPPAPGTAGTVPHAAPAPPPPFAPPPPPPPPSWMTTGGASDN